MTSSNNISAIPNTMVVVPPAAPSCHGISILPEEQPVCSLKARDRVLLYTRGISVDPLLGAELALDALKRNSRKQRQEEVVTINEGPAAQTHIALPTDEVCAAVEELFALLQERDMHLPLLDKNGQPLRSTPPMNRRPMIAEEMDRSLLKRAFHKLLKLMGRRRAA